MVTPDSATNRTQSPSGGSASRRPVRHAAPIAIKASPAVSALVNAWSRDMTSGNRHTPKAAINRKPTPKVVSVSPSTCKIIVTAVSSARRQRQARSLRQVLQKRALCQTARVHCSPRRERSALQPSPFRRVAWQEYGLRQSDLKEALARPRAWQQAYRWPENSGSCCHPLGSSL